jgi:adenylosuccinate lyase
VQSLDISAAEKQRLLAMTPQSYTGLAEQLAKRVIE